MPKRGASWRSAWALLALLGTVACSGSEDDTEPGSPAASAGSNATGGPSTSNGGSSATKGSGTETGSSGGSSQAEAGRSQGGTGGSEPGTAGGAGTSASGGSAGAMTIGPPPGPTEEGLSVYTVKCEGESTVCNHPEAACLGVFLDDDGVGYTCSNLCNTVADCSQAPTGAEAEPGCVEFTSAKRCVLVCYDHGNEAVCPDGMSCYRYPNSPIGYCLWL